MSTHTHKHTHIHQDLAEPQILADLSAKCECEDGLMEHRGETISSQSELINHTPIAGAVEAFPNDAHSQQ